MTEEERADWDEAITLTIIGKPDGTKFLSFLSLREIRPALSRYVLAEARLRLWHGMSEMHGSENKAGMLTVPGWLDKTADRDLDEADAAYFALEIAIQEEVERRVSDALEVARVQEKKTAKPFLRDLTQQISSALHRSAAEQQKANTRGAEKALEDAGLKSRGRRRKPAEL